MNVHLILSSAVYLFIHPKAKTFDPSINTLAVKMSQTFMEISLWVPGTRVSVEKMISSRSVVHVMHCKHDCHEELPSLLHKEKKTHCCVRSVAFL